MRVVLNHRANHLPRDILHPSFDNLQQLRCVVPKDESWHSTNHIVAVVQLVFRDLVREAHDANKPLNLPHTPQYTVLLFQVSLLGVPRLVVLGVGRRSSQEVAYALARELLHWFVVASVKQNNTVFIGV